MVGLAVTVSIIAARTAGRADLRLAFVAQAETIRKSASLPSRRNKRNNQVRPTANTGGQATAPGSGRRDDGVRPQQATERRHEGDRSQGSRPVRTVTLPATRAPGRQCTALERARRGTSTLPNHDTSALTKSPATLAIGDLMPELLRSWKFPLLLRQN